MFSIVQKTNLIYGQGQLFLKLYWHHRKISFGW